ncbi:hypothetical protein OAN307_c40430 [Octadecabacter antarcticus 307]|uniref:Dodecin domain-containing protein n=1 Tax=Octadecabacter antarcticus 307 TaxID=391626 RepID=M9RGG3_9RHOB|nr:dodecin family protein [Octadecabacter antarcticus]AGI69461.1 hypothetical protein OAN307_c40430 [Octadecabacter antarcticus 307]
MDVRKPHGSRDQITNWHKPTFNSVAKVIAIICSSSKSFDDAFENGIQRASKSLKGIMGAWVAGQKVTVSDGKIDKYRVVLKVTFTLADQAVALTNEHKKRRLP